MSISRVQSNMVASSGTVTSQAVTVSSGVTSGNLLVASVSAGNNATSVTPPTGWTQAAFNQPGGSANCESGIWWAIVGSGGVSAGTTSFTFNFGASHIVYIGIMELSSTTGWAPSPVDVTATGNASGTQNTTITSGTTATTAQAIELWFASLTYDGAPQTESGLTSGWTRDNEVHDGSNNHTALMCYNIVSSTGTAVCSFTIGTTQFNAGAVATFKPVVGTLTNKDTTFRGPVSAKANKNTTFRGPISQVADKNTIYRGNVGHTGIKNTTFRGVFSATAAKNTTFRGSVGHTAAHDTVFRGNVSAWLVSGGMTLFGNGTGTVSYDHFRVTEYPDPALSLAPVLPRLGSSNVSWNSNVPANTTLAVQTSLDGVNWSAATSGNSIPGLNGQPDPTIDLFNTDTSANYTNTHKTGGSGSNATVTYATANSRITLAGGVSGLYIYNAISCSDVDVIIDMDESDAGGCVWRFVDASNYYEIGVHDDTSGSSPNTLFLYKVSAATRSTLSSASITWPRSTVGASPYKRIRVTMLRGAITVYFDGNVLITYTDGSPLGAGKVGLRNDSGTSRYYQLRIQSQGDYVSGNPAADVVTGEFAYTQATLTTSDPSVTPQLLDLTTSARSPQIATGALITQLHDPSKPFAEYYSKEVTTIAQASGDFYWGVGPDAYGNPASLTFAARQATPAPWCLHSSDVKFSPTGPQTSIVTPTFAADLYRNRQTITNCTGVTGTLTETKIADGSATSWTVAYPIYSAPSISVQGVAQTVGIKGVDSGKQWYWQANNNTITQDSSATKIPSGYIITITYVGQFVQNVTEDNLPEQAARVLVETGTSGIVEAWEDGGGMLASNASVYALGLLARYANNNAVQLVTTTTRSGLQKGMVLPTFMAEHNLNNRQLLIVSITTTAEQDSTGSVLYYYTITATDGPGLQNWAAALGF